MEEKKSDLFEGLAKDRYEWFAAIGFLQISFARVEYTLDLMLRQVHETGGEDTTLPSHFRKKISYLKKNTPNDSFGSLAKEAVRLSEVRNWFAHGTPEQIELDEIEVCLAKFSKGSSREPDRQKFKVEEIKKAGVDCSVLTINLIFFAVYTLGMSDAKEIDDAIERIKGQGAK